MESQATITQPCAEGRVRQPGGGLADRVGISSGLGIQIHRAPLQSIQLKGLTEYRILRQHQNGSKSCNGRLLMINIEEAVENSAGRTGFAISRSDENPPYSST